RSSDAETHTQALADAEALRQRERADAMRALAEAVEQRDATHAAEAQRAAEARDALQKKLEVTAGHHAREMEHPTRDLERRSADEADARIALLGFEHASALATVSAELEETKAALASQKDALAQATEASRQALERVRAEADTQTRELEQAKALSDKES